MRTARPRDFLLTEARIIEEDTTHISIALTIEKAWIARNLPFLAALADHVGCTTVDLIAHK